MSNASGAFVTARKRTGSREPLTKRCFVFIGGANKLHGFHSNILLLP
jgi:hypothetical protein